MECFCVLQYLLIFTSFCFHSINCKDFYTFSVQDHENNAISLEQFRGKVSLVVNVATDCGYTESTYKALTTLHDILSYGGFFNVLAFPCNQFGEQEPREMTDIVQQAISEYGVEFPIFYKIDVVGADANPAFRNLIEQSSQPPEWNFYKYLVDGDGQVIKAWGTMTTIDDIFEEIQAAVVKAANKVEVADTDQTTEKDQPDRSFRVNDEL